MTQLSFSFPSTLSNTTNVKYHMYAANNQDAMIVFRNMESMP